MHAQLFQRADLVVHQRDQRRDDHRDAAAGAVPGDRVRDDGILIRSGEKLRKRITRRDGWSVERYQAWLRRMTTQIVFLPLQED